MRQDQELKIQVMSAVSRFANAVNNDQEIAIEITHLIEATSQIPLSNLDYWESEIRSELSISLNNTRSSTWKFWVKPNPCIWWVYLCCWDGFKREKTLRVLDDSVPNSFFLAIAIRRLNDWVPQVRAAAREKLISIVKNTSPEIVADVLCALLPHWISWGRMEESDRNILREIMSIEAITLCLKKRILSSPHGPMSKVLSQVCQTPILDKHLIEIATNAIQPAVRAKAYRYLLCKQIIWSSGKIWEWIDIRYNKGHYKPILHDRPLTIDCSFEETLAKAAIDRYPIVRGIAGEELVRELEKMGSSAYKYASLLASDHNLSVAEHGKYALKKLTANISS